MIHKRYINEFEDKPVDIEFWCPETIEENDEINNVVKKIELVNYFINGGKYEYKI